MFLGISRSLQLGDIITLEIIDIIHSPMLGETMLRILNHSFNAAPGFRISPVAQEDVNPC